MNNTRRLDIYGRHSYVGSSRFLYLEPMNILDLKNGKIRIEFYEECTDPNCLMIFDGIPAPFKFPNWESRDRGFRYIELETDTVPTNGYTLTTRYTNGANLQNFIHINDSGVVTTEEPTYEIIQM